MLARLFVFFGGLFVLALLAALVGPYFVDWTSYRADFEREASAVLGRKVTVKGEASARLLPFPSVTFSGVTVGGAAGAEPALTVETFSMDAELAPLLHGEFLIFDMRLVRPKGVIDVAEDGTIDWAVRPSTPFDAGRIALENLTVTDGEITLRHHAGGRDHTLSAIDATLSARSLAGPWRGEGTLALDGRRASVSTSTGTAAEGAMRLKLDVTPRDTPVRLTLEGDVRLRGGAAAYAGTFHLAQALSASASEGEAGKGGRHADPGFRLSGLFDFRHDKLAVSEFRLETGPREDPYAAEGKASVDLGSDPRFTLEANGEQMRLDDAPIDVEAGTGAGTGAGAAASPPLGFADRVAALETALRALPRPGIPGRVTVNLPAVVAGDTTVRDVRVAAEPAAGGWRVDALSATLPGRTTLEADGMLTTDGAFGFEGSLLVAVAQPSGFAAWVARDVNDAVRRLPTAGFSAHVQLSAARQSFDRLELVLGDARLRGLLVNTLPPAGTGARPSLALRLEGGQLDLDQLDAFASLFTGGNGDGRFAGRDVDVALKAGPVTGFDVSASRLDAAVQLRGDTLAIRRFVVGGLAGATVSASGSIAGLSTAPSGELSATLEAADLQPLAALAAGRFPRVAWLAWLDARARSFPGLLGDAKLTVRGRAGPGEGGSEVLSAKAEGVAGGSRLKATLASWGNLGTPFRTQLSLDASLRNGDGAPLLALAGLHAEPLGLTGPAELALRLSGVPAEGLDARVELTGKAFSAGFDGSVSATGAGLAVKGPIVLDAQDVEPWMLTAGAAVPGFGLGTPAELRAEADYADGLLVVSGIAGSVDESAVSGDVNVAMRNGLPEITGALSLDSLDLARVASVVLGAGAFDEAAQGAPARPFRETALRPFTAALGLSAGAVEVGALGTLYDADFTLSLDAGRMAVGGLTASFHDGTVKGSAELKNTGGTGLLSAQLALARANFATAFGGGGGIQGEGDFSVGLSASGKSVEGLIASLGGSGTAVLDDLHVAGLDQKALPALLARADASARNGAGQVTAGFAPALASQGSFVVDHADVAFTVAGGVLRAPPLTLSNPDASLTADLRADFNAGTVSAKGTVTFAAGADRLVGSEPALGIALEGPFETAGIVFDSAPLAQFLTQRALEKEQARVEAMQETLLEKQRLRREARYYQGLDAARRREAAEKERQAEAVRIRIDDRALLEAEAAKRAAAALAKQAADDRRVADAIRLAETERALREKPGVPAPAPRPARDPAADIFRNIDDFNASAESTQ